MLGNLLNNFGSYAQGGMAWMAGFEPVMSGAHNPGFIGPPNAGAYHGAGAMPFGPLQTGVAGRNSLTWRGWGTQWTQDGGKFRPLAPDKVTGIRKWGGIGGSALGAGLSGYFIYQGFKEGGLSGGKDAAVWDVATSSAVARFAYGAVGTSGVAGGPGSSLRARMAMLGAKPAGAKVVFGGGAGLLSGVTRSIGAGIGASIGQGVLGTPGAFIGGYIGVAPIRFMATHPLLAAGMIAGAATAHVGYGTYSVVKGTYQAGAAHAQNQRGINTSGSMAAFMTSGAQTMRARAVQAIHKSHLNARSALGQEAGFMHAPGKNYHSMYR
jgi:hypothetical protein